MPLFKPRITTSSLSDDITHTYSIYLENTRYSATI